VRHDPGVVLLILRQAARAFSSPAFSAFPTVVQDPAVLEGAIRFLAMNGGQEAERNPDHGEDSSFPMTGFVDWNRSALRPVYFASLRGARLAYDLAERSGRCNPDNAWVAGLVAPLGWLAVCAAAPERAIACLADPELPRNPRAVQVRHWGHDHAGIARRLLRRWRMPHWLSVVAGYLGLPVEMAQTLGAEPDLFRVVQLAVRLVQQNGKGLYLAVGTDLSENFAALEISAGEQERLTSEASSTGGLAFPIPEWNSPYNVPLLRDLLCLAVQNQRLRGAPALEQLEQERDQLYLALEQRRAEEAERLRLLKLNALAEFAAGAAHEINNPLAVISGQAQYLLGHETESSRQHALQTIIGQTQRVHRVLRELMQFARPPRPQRQAVDLSSLLREVTVALEDLAVQRQVRLVCDGPDPAIRLEADARQIRTALECLLRNAIEAAPPSGWAGIRWTRPAADCLELVIEDNGDGPTPAERDHLFDPFYSGRQAGRGRGLGLPTAWRLAQEHGGDVRFERPAGGPTRFVLRLPYRAALVSQEPVNGHPDTRHAVTNGCALPATTES
jgi:signal transduction histidine kinase